MLYLYLKHDDACFAATKRFWEEWTQIYRTCIHTYSNMGLIFFVSHPLYQPLICYTQRTPKPTYKYNVRKRLWYLINRRYWLRCISEVPLRILVCIAVFKMTFVATKRFIGPYKLPTARKRNKERHSERLTTRYVAMEGGRPMLSLTYVIPARDQRNGFHKQAINIFRSQLMSSNRHKKLPMLAGCFQNTRGDWSWHIRNHDYVQVSLV